MTDQASGIHPYVYELPEPQRTQLLYLYKHADRRYWPTDAEVRKLTPSALACLVGMLFKDYCLAQCYEERKKE